MPETRDIPVLFITAARKPATSSSGFRVGAVDYILKPFHAEEVVTRVDTHLKLSRLTRELAAAERRTRGGDRPPPGSGRSARPGGRSVFHILLRARRSAGAWPASSGSSPHLERILADIERLQQFGQTSVLITGESGTGKELVARAIHHHSPRASGPFVPVNCVAIPGELAESIFFGHMKGSFTGATADRKGYFELADGGTLFLDEIGDMPATLQAKLLRVLEDGEVTPVGASNRGAWTCASSPPPMPTCRQRSPRATSGRISISGSRASPWRRRRCASAPRTFRC